jgi:hypothetical protein
MRLLNERLRVLKGTLRDWLAIQALESVLLSFFKGGSTQTVQPIPLLIYPECGKRRRPGLYPRR